MSIKFKYGKGEGKSYDASLGENIADLKESDKNLNLKQIAKILKEQLEIKNGNIEIVSINFLYKKGVTVT